MSLETRISMTIAFLALGLVAFISAYAGVKLQDPCIQWSSIFLMALTGTGMLTVHIQEKQ